MSKFYSSLIINGKNFSNVHQVFKPRYNKEFFKRLVVNVEELEKHIGRRCKTQTLDPTQNNFATFKEDSQKLVKLKEQLEKIEKKNPDDEFTLLSIKDQLIAIEERIMPLTVSIPNRASKQVPQQDNILDEVKPDFAITENLTKVLSHTKLSYINNCYSKSVVGPNSHYYYGLGARLQYGLSDYFASNLEKRDHINVSGLCLAKSAVVEATNSRDIKDYTTDSCRILTNDFAYTTLHLVEASRESLMAFVSTLGPRSSNIPLRLMISGAGYRSGSNWFDSDDKRVTQYETLHATTLNSSIEQYSMKEYHETIDYIWNLYKSMNLPTRLVHCSLDNMISNEYDTHRIDLWLPSRQEWLQVSRISHYLDYLTLRLGMKRGHIIDTIVYDGQALFAAIVENNQTSNGKFIIPSVIKSHMPHFSDHERDSYFRESKPIGSEVHMRNLTRSAVLNNHEQRRYLKKKNYSFSHSVKAASARRGPWIFGVWFYIMICGLVLLGTLIDWMELYIQYMPKRAKRLCYDYFFRPIRRAWRSMTDGDKLEDLSFNEMDWSEHEKTMSERRKERFNERQFKVEVWHDGEDK